MQKPLEISFTNMDASPAVEAEIRKHVEKLEKLYDRLTHCRVSVELQHRQHRTGNVFEVHIDLGVPGDELAVSREPHRAKQRYAAPDIRTSIRDAFKAAERRLKDFKQRQRGEVKPHDATFQGQVSQLADDHGFILTHEGTQLYFHRNSVMDDSFAKLKLGDPVHFVEQIGDTGPLATKVWLGPDYHLD
ncbi:MAG TPA: HPF/RaiA family ribosome-associated protein [Stellaceae bacterium]|nr:HPF/RaiA family ribosome-associated protein [Stellaceae bacterium]